MIQWNTSPCENSHRSASATKPDLQATKSPHSQREIPTVARSYDTLSLLQQIDVAGRYSFTTVSQSCAVTKSEKFWRATEQSNLSYKRLAATKASKVWFSYTYNCSLANWAVFHSVCQVWLSSGPPLRSQFPSSVIPQKHQQFGHHLPSQVLRYHRVFFFAISMFLSK